MLVAAIADGEEIEPVLGAGATLPGLEEAEVAGLLSIGAGRVRFRHPLVRSVAVHTAEPALRRAAHRAYAVALGPEAGDGPALVAHGGGLGRSRRGGRGRLAAAGERARGRGGHAAAAAASSRRPG